MRPCRVSRRGETNPRETPIESRNKMSFFERVSAVTYVTTRVVIHGESRIKYILVPEFNIRGGDSMGLRECCVLTDLTRFNEILRDLTSFDLEPERLSSVDGI